ncbi:Piwi domain-containing protein [Collybia nuda]|uniref:Piwi domain-containing protein n=1 Tax=Collybia nuda TaxID=64659 RepID=A0A9P5XVS8_9AGAR|nr:Piwi domain-containing protein [Collybia nuda]
MSTSIDRKPGTAGTKLLALTNAFEMKWAPRTSGSGYVYHYDVITPLWDSKTKEIPIGNRKGTELIMRLQEQIQPSVFNPLGAFDGKKNLFSFQQYRFTSEEFQVPWESGSSHRPKNVSIKVVFVRKINVDNLKKILMGEKGSMNPEGEAAITLNMLNVFVQATPRMQDPRIYNTKSFFTPLNKSSSDKIRPLELWRGYFQSVRPTFGKVIVNVDVTVGVIMPVGPLEKLCADHLRVRDLSRLNPPDIQKLRLFVKGLKVEIVLPGHQGKRPKTIKDLVTNVGETTFEKNGVKTTVAEHFKLIHNSIIRPRSLGVRFSRDGDFPMSVCRTVQQLFKSRTSPEIVREALAFSPASPLKRMQAIKAGWQQLHYENSPFLIGAGINVLAEPMQVKGRQLPPLQIGFKRDHIIPQRSGVWDVMRKKFITPATVRTWIVVDFAAADMEILNRFVHELHQAMMDKGISIPAPHNIIRRDPGSGVAGALLSAGRESKPDMILVILPESAASIYRDVKRFGDITVGVVTQCVKWSQKLASDAQHGRCNQYHNNLILKINAKLGGTSCVPLGPAMDYLGQLPTMVLGADVSHPGPGSALPSIAALVSSFDKRVCAYAASIRVQESRTEVIVDLTNMFAIALKTFKGKNHGLLPKRIFFFRDGVSEGEFTIVLEKELSAMKAATINEYGPDTKNWPQLTFIIVGKRHHFRFFPLDHRATDSRGNDNLHAGFVVDQDIIHPVYPDFYLQSQAGLKGTSRPSHYTVLANGGGLPLDNLQQIAFALCHCYQRSTRSVKIPAPVYYADLVCRRAKFHFDDDINFSDDMSSHSDERSHVDFYKDHFSKINEAIRDKMYFV